MMEKVIRKGTTDRKNIIFLFIMSVLSGALSAFAGLALASVCGGFLAALWFFEPEEKRIFSYIAIPVILAIDILLNGIYTLVGVFAIVLGLMIFLVYRLRFSKCESVFGMTIVAALLILLAYILLALGNKDGLGVKEYYAQIYDEYKVYFIESFAAMYEAVPELKETILITEDDVVTILDTLVSMLVSFVIIYGFALVGIACKIFKIMVRRYSEDKKDISDWNFMTPSIYAYFYIALTIAGFFVGSELNEFALVVMNLSSIFMVVYAYIGWNCASKILATRRNPMLSNVIMFVVILCFGNLALNLLSFFGMFYTLSLNRFYSERNSDNNEK
jgi:hypothetical protein